MLKIIKNIPNIKVYPLTYVFEHIKLKQKDSLWLEFGVASGKTINYISKFASGKVYGFDSFQGLPEKMEKWIRKRSIQYEWKIANCQ